MGLFTTESLEYLESHHGIASLGMLKSLGLSPFTVRRLVEAGNLEAVLRGVYRMPAVPLDQVARVRRSLRGAPGGGGQRSDRGPNLGATAATP